MICNFLIRKELYKKILSYFFFPIRFIRIIQKLGVGREDKKNKIVDEIEF